MLGAFVAQDLALFVLFFDLMLVPFYFLLGQWGGPDRVAAAVKMVVYTLVGSLLMLAAAVATAVLSSRRRADVRALRPAGEPARRGHAEAAVRGLRPCVPYQDAELPVPRLDAGRLPEHAAPGARRLLRRGLEGRRVRLPADRAAAVPGGRRRLAADPARALAALDPLRLGAGLHADEHRASSSATRRSPSSGSSRWGSSRSTRRAAGRRARCCRRSTTGSSSRRCS